MSTAFESKVMSILIFKFEKFMTRIHMENAENIRLEYERWAKEYQHT